MLSIKRVNKYFELAKEASEESDFPQHHLGAVVIYKGIPLASSCNSTKTNPAQKYYNRERKGFNVDAEYENTNSLHAEISCLLKIRNLDIDFSKANLFVYRETANGKKALSKPCKACEAAIKELGIKNVYYTIENGWEHTHWD